MPTSPYRGYNVLLIVLDTVRTDRLSCYGNGRDTTPRIDMLTARGVRFDHVFANSSWTLSSHASIFTGLYPVAHRATQETIRLSDTEPTLAEIFTDAGYQTFGASSNPVVRRKMGLARGFEVFYEVFREEGLEYSRVQPTHRNNVAFASFLSTAERGRPFFAFLNYIEAHLPYGPPPKYRKKFVGSEYTRAQITLGTQLAMRDHYANKIVTPEDFKLLGQLYDGEVASLDDAVGDLIDSLAVDGRLDSTIVIITSDHGENIGEHNQFAHVLSIYNTLLHVPLVVVFPDGAHAGEVRTDVAELLDLFPTLLNWCGVPYDGRYDGRDLFAPGAESVEKSVMAEYYYPRQVLNALGAPVLKENMEEFLPYMRRMRALQDGQTKLIWGSDGRHELYDIARDPDELTNLLDADPKHPKFYEMLDALLDRVETHQGEPPLDPPPPPFWKVKGMEEFAEDEEVLEKLRALGYVR